MLVFVGLVATFASYCTTSNAMQILLYSYELYDSCLIVPLLMSYFQADLKKGSAIGAILLGLAGFILVHTIALPISGQIVSFALSGIGFYVGGHAETTLKKFVVLKTSKSAHCGNI
jgi:hypothetical protein